MKQQPITPFFMFEGQAEEAMNFYLSVFDDSEVNNVIRYEDGTITHATFTLKGLQFMCIDSAINHAFTFTPSISLFVECDTKEEVENYFDLLSSGGEVLMPLGPLPVSELFGWVKDKFSITWQLNLGKVKEITES